MKTKIKVVCHRLAAKPQASFKRFIFGQGLFVIGLLPLLFAPAIPWLNNSSLALIALGAIIAVTGYIGILAERIIRFWQI